MSKVKAINGQTITTKRARPRLGQSAQAKWQRKMLKAGRCRACGEPRPLRLKQLCEPCQQKSNDYMKKYRAQKKVKEAVDVILG
jgi:hypothetical protein